MPDGPGCAVPRLPEVHGKRTLWKGRCVVHGFASAHDARCPQAKTPCGRFHEGRLAHSAPRQRPIRRCFLAGAVPPRDRPSLGIPWQGQHLYIAPPVFFNRRENPRPVRPQKKRAPVSAPQGLPFNFKSSNIAADLEWPLNGLMFHVKERALNPSKKYKKSPIIKNPHP